MRSLMTAILVLAAAAALGACRARAPGESASAKLVPAAESARKPGLWVQHVVADDGAQTVRICLDSATDQTLAAYGRQANAGCEKHEMTRRNDGLWEFSTVCDLGAAGKVATEGTISGDFVSRYHISARSRAVGADRPSHYEVDSTWQGACPDGMKVGDVLFGDDGRYKVADLAPAK